MDRNLPSNQDYEGIDKIHLVIHIVRILYGNVSWCVRRKKAGFYRIYFKDEEILAQKFINFYERIQIYISKLKFYRYYISIRFTLKR